MFIHKILNGPIQFHEAPDDNGGGKEADSFSLPDVTVDGDTAPNFDAFFTPDGAKREDVSVEEIDKGVKLDAKDPKSTPIDDGSGKATKKEPEARTDDPDAKAEPEKKEPEAKKAEPQKKAEADVKAEAEKKKTEDAEKKKQEDDERRKNATEEEIDGMGLKKSVSDQTRDQFAELRGIAKAKAKLAVELEAKVKELESKTGEALTPELKSKLEDYERRLKIHELEGNPELQAEFRTKTEAVEKSLFDLLCEHPQLRLPRETPEGATTISAKMIQEAGVDTQEGRALLAKIIRHVQDNVDDPILAEDIRDAIRARGQVSKDHKAMLESLRGDQTKFNETRAKAEAEKGQKWAETAHMKLAEILQGEDTDWANLREPEKGATPEQLKAIEAHNKNLQEKVVPVIQERMRGVWNKDPQVAMEMVYASVERDHVKGLLKAEKEQVGKLKAELERVRRVANGVQKVSEMKSDSIPQTKTPQGEESVFQSAGDAMDQFFKK